MVFKVSLILLPFLLSLTALAQERLEIITIGHPTLRAQAEEVPLTAISTPQFQKYLDDMVFTMKEARGVGLAAPQVNQSLRLFVMKSLFPRVSLRIVINPKIEYLEPHGKKSSTEGCLSIPGKQVKVSRFKKIHISYYDRNGEFISEELSGFAAIIAQHEYDHLNGVLIVDLVEQMKSIMNYSGYTSAPLM